MDVLPLSSIGNGIKNPRGAVGDVSDLVESILNNGLINPLTVVRNADGTYERVCGARRMSAIEYIIENHQDHPLAADFASGVPVNVLVGVSEMEAMAIAFEENTKQKGHELTSGQRIRYVVAIYRVENDQKRTGELTGLSQPSVSQYVKIVESSLADLSLSLLDEGKVTQKLVLKVIDNIDDNAFGKDLLEAVADGRVQSSVAVKVCNVAREDGIQSAREALEALIAGDTKKVKSSKPTAKEQSAMLAHCEQVLEAPGNGPVSGDDIKAFMAGMRYVRGETPKFLSEDGETHDLIALVEYIHEARDSNVVEMPTAPTGGVKKVPVRKAQAKKTADKNPTTKKTAAKKAPVRKGKRLAVGAK